MKYFDTHCHLFDEAFDEDRAGVLERMAQAGVQGANIVHDPGEPKDTLALGKEIAWLAPWLQTTYTLGVHPHNASMYTDEIEAQIRAQFRGESIFFPCKPVLWGEIGLDYHYDLSPREVQREVFARQLDAAYETGVPVQLHIREAQQDCADILASAARSGRLPLGIMHCFTGQWEEAKYCLDLGLYISFSGALTFKKSEYLREVCQKTPSERILIETDCPYMAPVPLRGRRNEPSFVPYVAQTVAKVREMDMESTAQMLWENTRRLLQIKERDL